MKKQKKTIVKQKLKKCIWKYDDQSYKVFIPIDYISYFKNKFISNNILKESAEYYDVERVIKNNRHYKTGSYKLSGYDYFVDKQKYDYVYEFYYNLLLSVI